MWQDSPKIRDITNFRAYRIYRKKISENPPPFEFLKVLPIKASEASASGAISFPNFDNFQRRYLDVNIEYLSNYEYTVSLVRRDGVEGPRSSIGQDTTQGGSRN
jgi:hypothetical protein